MHTSLPRSSWTSDHRSDPSKRGDNIDGLPYWTAAAQPVGIQYYLLPEFINSNVPPQKIFSDMLKENLNVGGLSDIRFNLGVAGSVQGVWHLRGLHNKSSPSFDLDFNSQYVSVLILANRGTKPTDTLLGNIVDARRMVHSRYPGASEILPPKGNEWLEKLFGQDIWDPYNILPTPVVNFPSVDLKFGDISVHVHDLQEYLTSRGMYHVKVHGTYTEQTADAVKELQASLTHYKGELHGNFDLDTKLALGRADEDEVVEE